MVNADIADIQLFRQTQTMSEITPHQQRLRENAREAMVGFRGLWAAKLWIVLPVVISLLIMWAFGEGDYIAPIMFTLWIGCLILGLRFYRSGAPKTVRRSMGLHTIVWSIFFALMTFAWTVALIVGGTWRWTPPHWR